MGDDIKKEQVNVKGQPEEQTNEDIKKQDEIKNVEGKNDTKENKSKIEKRSEDEDDKEEEDKREIKKMKTEIKVEEEKKVEENEKEKIENKPKFVFGAATSFGSGFKITKNMTSDNDKKDNEIISSNIKPFAFGSKFSFGSGFNILKEKKLDENTPAKLDFTSSKDKKNDEADEKSTIENNQPNKNIKLHKQEVKSGEETETCLFQANMKLYQLHNIKEGWKERGVGILKLNKDDTTQKSRIVMRSRGILKVILNLPLIKGFSIKKGFPGSLQSEKFIRIIAIDDKNLPVTYALKCANPDSINELYDKIEELIPKD